MDIIEFEDQEKQYVPLHFTCSECANLIVSITSSACLYKGTRIPVSPIYKNRMLHQGKIFCDQCLRMKIIEVFDDQKVIEKLTFLQKRWRKIYYSPGHRGHILSVLRERKKSRQLKTPLDFEDKKYYIRSLNDLSDR